MRLCRPLIAALLCPALAGCFQLGQSRVGEDQLGYSRALSESDRSQTLLNVVRLRYAEAPTFLDTTQVISAYQLQHSVTGGFEVFPSAAVSTFLSGSGTAQLQQSPTFTFQPLTGEHFAQSFLRPLSLADILPLVQGGLPVDVLFRLAVQSAGTLQNAMALTRDASGGSRDFFELIHALRRLQEAGLLGVRIERESRTAADGKPMTGPERVFLTIGAARDHAGMPEAALVRRLMALPPGAGEMEVVYGREARSAGQVAVLTRSMLGVLGQVAFQIEVPPEDVASGRTVASVPPSANERRPVVLVHAGPNKPDGALTAIQYRGQWFWIADDDFDSKVAFAIVNIIIALAKTSTAPSTVLTIPTK